jgi:hypothetical protein
MQTSKFNIGDRVSFTNETGVAINCTVKDIGVFGGKLSPKRAYIYTLRPDNCEGIKYGVLEHALTKIED